MIKMIGFLAIIFSSLSTNAAEPKTLEQLLERVRADRILEREIDQQRETRFLQEHDKQQQRLSETKTRLKNEKVRNTALTSDYDKNNKALDELRTKLQSKSADLGELFGTVHQMAADSSGLLKSSLVSAQLPGRAERALALADSKELPSIKELEQLWHSLLDEMVSSGKIETFNSTIITKNGTEEKTDVIRVGAFNAIANGRFLRYLPETARLIELPRQPGGRYLAMAETLQNAKAGDRVDIALDPSRGAILALLTRTPNLWERIQQGGYIGYIILLLGAIGLLIVLERFIVLMVTKRKVKTQQAQLEDPNLSNPLGRLLTSYNEHAQQNAQSLVLRLEEKIQQEIPAIQRGLAVIAMLAAITPLLGLLGTVTGMIATFQSITLFGTGDPKLMSGGISQALVTTELGLAVAIPLMLLHTLLAGKSRWLVNTLDEHSTALVATKVESGKAEPSRVES